MYEKKSKKNDESHENRTGNERNNSKRTNEDYEERNRSIFDIRNGDYEKLESVFDLPAECRTCGFRNQSACTKYGYNFNTRAPLFSCEEHRERRKICGDAMKKLSKGKSIDMSLTEKRAIYKNALKKNGTAKLCRIRTMRL